jgi:hypothetical protein
MLTVAAAPLTLAVPLATLCKYALYSQKSVSL